MKLHFNETTLEVQPNDSSYRYRSLMAKPQLVLKFSLPEYVEIPVGAWCEYMGERYILHSPQNIKKNGVRNIEYTLNMGTLQDNMALYMLRNSVDHRLKFGMNGKPHEFIDEIVSNLNERDGANVWSRGTCIEANEKTIEFNHTNVDAALSQVAETFETEWEIVGNVIHLHKVEYYKNDPLPLSYGKGNGFMPGVGRTTPSNELPIKRLYVQGGDRNIDRSKYGSQYLLLPKSQQLVYEGRTYQSDADGYYIERVDRISDAVKEDSLDCSEHYPSRVGTVTSVIAVKPEKNFYDFIDNTIPADLDFNDYIIEGETATIIFQSGILAGKEFEFKYKHSERRFEIVPQEIDGQTMPNNIYKPNASGTLDTYAIFGIMMPQSYICDNEAKEGASWDMFREAAKHLYENEEQKFTFTGTLQSLYAKRNWVNIGGKLIVGGYIHFSDAQFAQDGVDIRIVGIKDFLTSPYSPTVEISNNVPGQSLTSKLREIDAQEVVIEENHKDALQFTRRRFRDAQETLSMLEDAMDNFSGSMNPITVQTMAMLVGDESLQFQFVQSKTSANIDTSFQVTYDAANKQLSVPHSFLRHMTIGINAIKSSHSIDEYKTWEMTAYISARLEDGSKKYYLYAKVDTAVAQNGEFLLSETPIDMDRESGYYHLLLGVLNSEYDEQRSYVSLYGFTEILPARITTDKIVSSGGNSYFDLVANAFKLGDVLDFNSSGDGKLRLKGTIVQSQSGDSSHIGCFRGSYNSSVTYYQGDEVTYTADGCTSTYRYIYPSSSKGVAPSNNTYWEVIAQGVQGAQGIKGEQGERGPKGIDGIAPRMLFMNSDSQPSTPTAVNPAGWHNAPQNPAFATEVDNMSDFTVESLSSYGFVEVIEGDTKFFRSDNNNVHSSTAKAKIKFMVNADCSISFIWAVSSEPNYDKGSLYALDDTTTKAVNSVSGSQSGTYTVKAEKGEHFIIAEYKKDGSGNSNADYFIVQPTIEKVKVEATVSKHVWSTVEILKDGVFAGWSEPVRWNGSDGKNAIILKAEKSYNTSELNNWTTIGSTYTWTVLDLAGAELGRAVTVVVDNTTTGGYREYYGIITDYTSAKQVSLRISGYSDNGASGSSPVVYEADFDTTNFIVDNNGEIKNTLTINIYKVVGNSRTAHIAKEIDSNAYYPNGGLGYNSCGWNNVSQVIQSPAISDYCDDATETYKDYAYIRFDVTFVDGVVKQYVIQLIQEGQQGPQGPQGPQGDSGVSIVAQYSANGTSWHSPFATGDKWMRTRMSNSSTWGAAMKIVGENGTDGIDGTNGSYMDYRFAISNVSETGSSTTEPAHYGSWSDAPVPTTADYPYLWMRTQMMEWHASGNAYIGGTKYYVRLTGENGTDGNYVEMRYAKNGSPTAAPSIDPTSETPSGWSISPPSTGVAEYLWMTKCVKTASGELVTNWTTPVRLKGDKGEDGKSPAMVFRGEYNESATYYGNKYRLDCVKYEEAYYIARIDAGTFSGTIPTDSNKWNPFGATFDSVATQLLLAENANIAGWIFRNGRLESEVRDKNGDPMAYLNGKTGEMRLRGTMQLSTAFSGNFSDSNIFYLPTLSSGTKSLSMGYEKEDIGKVVRLFNSSPFGGGIYKISGNSFRIEGGISYSETTYYALCEPQEVIEMTCFERTGSSETSRRAEWVLTGRFGIDNFKLEAATGRFPRILAMGTLFGSASTPYLSGYMWNGKRISTVFTLSKNGTGNYSVKFTSGTLPNGYYGFFSGMNGNWKGSIFNQTSTGFDVYISDDASLNDGDVNFIIFDPNWYYEL